MPVLFEYQYYNRSVWLLRLHEVRPPPLRSLSVSLLHTHNLLMRSGDYFNIVKRLHGLTTAPTYIQMLFACVKQIIYIKLLDTYSPMLCSNLLNKPT